MTALDARPSPRDLGAPELAGYRVLRSLARDDGAEILLGHRSVGAPSGDGAAADEAARAGARGGAGALKVFPATQEGCRAALGECAALERARGDHVVDLLDVDADEASIRLVFERLTRGDLAELLRIRTRFDAGEAVTLLAPIVIALERMHAAGVAHGNVGARTVMFRDDGAPTLIGFSQAALFEPGAPEVVLEQVEAVLRDRAAIRALALTVLARVSGGQARAARELRDDIDAGSDEGILPLLGSRLFEVAAAVAVSFTPDEPEPDAPNPTRRAVPVGSAVVESAEPSGAARSSIARRLSQIVPEALVSRVFDTVEHGPVAAVADAVGRRWRALTPARRRAAVALGVAATTVAVLTAMIPAGPVSTGASAHAASDVSSGSPALAGSERAPTDAATDPATDPALDDAAADDPVAAAGALIRARDRCLSSLSLSCLDGVDEPGSSAMDDDRATIRSAQQGGELPDPLQGDDDGSPALIERLGDSALVRVGQQASGPSLLLVKGDAGWRIRDVVAADDAGIRSTG
jgi:hypothetical protein